MAYHLKRIGFNLHSVYTLKQPSAVKIAKQKISFLIASLSLFAFVVGNMVGQHGWYAFWKTVLGKEDVVAYVGMVPPIAKVPDYQRWITYGGTPSEHTYRMVPSDLLVPLPAYDVRLLRNRSGDNLADSVYSVGNLGSYTTGDDHSGSHAGVDIRVPVGTPVLSIANGIVDVVKVQGYGFGNHVVIKHPNVPDPDYAGKTTTLYSVYAHVDAILVSDGQTVHKGETVALSGQTGEASGPHLHFQLDREDAPYHPYWPFTTKDLANAGMSFFQGVNSLIGQANGEKYTVSPLLYIQSNISYTPQQIVAQVSSDSTLKQAAPRVRQTLAERTADRRRQRMPRASVTTLTIPPPVVAVSTPPTISAATPVTVTVPASVVPVAEPIRAPVVADNSVGSPVPVPSGGSTTDVDHLVFEHAGTIGRTWQKVTLKALDRNGNVVMNPSFAGKVYIIPEFGQVEIRPSELKASDFVHGDATINIISRGGKKTVILSTRGAFKAYSAPIAYDR